MTKSRERQIMGGSIQVTLNPEELRRMQLIQLEMLEEFDRICTKYNIKYIIDSGTLLGAVRHKGFIPWDDDVDVSMLRGEYEKFCEICEDEINSSKYFFQNHDTDSEYRWGYSKILRKNTTYIRLGQEHMKMRKGVFIDIFPMDGVPKNYFLWWIQKKLCFCARKIMWSEVGKIRSENKGKRIWFKIINLIPLKVAHGIINFWPKRIKEERSEYVNCSSIEGYSDFYGRELKRKYYIERKQIEFEGKMFWAPKDTDGWLSTVYGSNYMQLPEPEKRLGSATTSYFDLGKFQIGEEDTI